MTALTVHSREVETIFDLLESNEDGMTYALGWALTQSPAFLSAFCEKLGLSRETDGISVDLQKSRTGFGRTDIEIVSPKSGMVIIEAKQGFVFPSEDQLQRYYDALQGDMQRGLPAGHLVVLTSFPEAVGYASPAATPKVAGKTVPVQFLSWKSVVDLAEKVTVNARGRSAHVLREFISYLRRCVTMQDRQSNMAYVVALSDDTFADGNISFIDVVEKYQRYFHPVGNHYPTTPPNYLGFRYYGQLQSIHFVEDVEVITQFGPYFPGTSNDPVEPHFLYTLGPAIKPSQKVRSGPIRNMRCYCMLDTLLSCASVQEALQESKRRLEM